MYIIQVIQESIARIRKSNPQTTTTTSTKHNKNTTNTTTNNKITKTNSQTLPKLPPTSTTNNTTTNTNILSKSKFSFSTYNEDKLMAIKRPNANLNPLPPTLQPDEESYSEKIPLKLPNIYASTDQKGDNTTTTTTTNNINNTNNNNNNNSNNNNNNNNNNNSPIFAAASATAPQQQPHSVLYEHRQARIDALYTLLTELQTQHQQYQQQGSSSDRGSEKGCGKGSGGSGIYDKRDEDVVQVEGEEGDSVFSHEQGVTVNNAIYDPTTTATDTTITETPPHVTPAEILTRERDTVVEILTNMLNIMELIRIK